MDKPEHKGARLISDDLVSVTPGLRDIQICFPPELGMKNRNIWGEIIEDKYHIMKVKEWLKQKKKMFTIEEGGFTFVPTSPLMDGVIARYSQKKVNPGFYGTIKIEGKSED